MVLVRDTCPVGTATRYASAWCPRSRSKGYDYSDNCQN